MTKNILQVSVYSEKKNFFRTAIEPVPPARSTLHILFFKIICQWVPYLTDKKL